MPIFIRALTVDWTSRLVLPSGSSVAFSASHSWGNSISIMMGTFTFGSPVINNLHANELVGEPERHIISNLVSDIEPFH
jgi:hypothetical protein